MRKRIKRALILIAVLLITCIGTVLAKAEESEGSEGTYSGQIIFLHTNDAHGAVTTWDDDGKAVLGVASAAEMKRDLEEMGAYVLLLDAGDFASGTPLVRSSEGAAVVDFMNTARYDAVCIGDSEFDYGYPQLKTLADRADFPFLAANVRESDPASLQSHTVFTAPDGTKIGVFGLVTPEINTKVHPARTEGVTILENEALISCAREQVAQLQDADCDLIVCLGHLGTDDANAGNRSIDVIQNVDGIDLFIDGHSHETITDGDAVHRINNTMLVSAGASFENIGMVTYDGTSFQSALYSIREYSGVNKDVDGLVRAAAEEYAAQSQQVFANATVSLNRDGTRESNFGDLVSDAMFWKASQIDGDIDAAILDSGSLCDTLPVGEVTREMVSAALPADETLRIIEVTGAELLEVLEASTQYAPAAFDGFPQGKDIQYIVDTNVAFNPAKPGQRVTMLSVNSRKFDPAATYTIATSDRLAGGTGTYAAFSRAAVGYDLNIPLDEVVNDYITEVLAGEIGSDYAEPKGRATVIFIPFTDVSISDWYFDAIQYVYEHNIMKGMSEQEFGPMVSMSRAMLVTMLYRLAGSPSVSTSASHYFTDVPDNMWYANAVVWAVEHGITKGVGDQSFEPDEILNRQQMATFFYRYAKLYSDVSVADGYELHYYDTAEIADWALDAVSYCTATGLMKGMGNNEFAPRTAANRAMGATVFMRFMQLTAVS